MNIHLYFTTNLVFVLSELILDYFPGNIVFLCFFLLEEAAYAALIVKDKKS